VYQLIAAGELPAIRNGNALKIPRLFFESWITAKNDEAAAAYEDWLTAKGTEINAVSDTSAPSAAARAPAAR